MRGIKPWVPEVITSIVLTSLGVALHYAPFPGSIVGRVLITLTFLNVAFFFAHPRYAMYRAEFCRNVRWWLKQKLGRLIFWRRSSRRKFPSQVTFPTAPVSKPATSQATQSSTKPADSDLDSEATAAVIPSSSQPSSVTALPVVELDLKTTRMSESRAAGYEKIGAGGEAVVRKVDDATAIKVFRQPDDEWYAGADPEQERQRRQAADRLSDYPEKLPQFPRWVGSRVVAPQRLLRIGSYPVGGYQMELIADSLPLRKYASGRFKRKKKIDQDFLGRLMLDLYDTVCELHACGMLVGDFKPENVLVRDGKCYIVDAESMAYGDFRCRTFSDNYVDPRLCDMSLDYQLLVKAYDRDADWYAFTVILFEILTNLNPYAGVYTAPIGGKVVKQEERPLRLISVFNRDVTVPNFTQSIDKLPMDLQRFFFNTFEAGLRGQPKRELIEQLVQGSAPQFVPADHTCWKGHALPEVAEVDPEVLNLPSLLESDSQFLASGMYDKRLHFLYQRGAEVFREDGTLLLENDGDDFNVFQVGVDSFLFGTDHINSEDQVHDGPFYFVKRGQRAVMVPQVDPTPDGVPNIGIQNGRVVWIENGKLRSSQQESPLAELPGTLELFSGLSFDLILSTVRGSFNELYMLKKDKVRRLTSLPPLMGRVSDFECVFSSRVAWLFLTTTWDGRRTRHVIVIDARGNLRALGAAPESDSSWYSKGVLKCAFSTETGQKRIRKHDKLAVLTASGLVELGIVKKSLSVQIDSVRSWQADSEPQALVYTEAGLAVALAPQELKEDTNIDSNGGPISGNVSDDITPLFSFNFAN